MSAESFWVMGGYGFYVWTAYGFTALVLIWTLCAPIWQRRQWLQKMSRKRRSS